MLKLKQSWAMKCNKLQNKRKLEIKNIQTNLTHVNKLSYLIY